MPAVVDLTGRRYGRLVVIKRAGSRNGKAMWLCRCDCGNYVTTLGNSLQTGRTKSCGCLSREIKAESHTTHGRTRHARIPPLYRTWLNMKQRCLNPSATAYKNYGARGITVCNEWRRSYEAFECWALSHGYKHGLQIDRIDNDGGYCPENCHFVTREQNMRNTRTNRFITLDGTTRCKAEWAKLLGISESTLCPHVRHDSDGGISYIKSKLSEKKEKANG